MTLATIKILAAVMFTMGNASKGDCDPKNPYTGR
jgi:hypothetical protein